MILVNDYMNIVSIVEFLSKEKYYDYLITTKYKLQTLVYRCSKKCRKKLKEEQLQFMLRFLQWHFFIYHCNVC